MDDNRKSPRTLVHWRAAIMTESHGQRETTQGMTNDISTEGVSVICHRNISPKHPVTVYLLIHTGDEDNPELVFEAQGMVMNNVLSGKQGGFRLGIQFTKFAGDGKNILQKYMPKNPGYGAAYAAPPAEAPRPAKAKTAPAEEVAAPEGAAPAAEPPASPEAAPVADASPVADPAPVDSSPQDTKPPQ